MRRARASRRVAAWAGAEHWGATSVLCRSGTLLACNFNVAQAARGLGARHQTAYDRLERSRAMLGDLDDPKQRRGLELARGETRD
ncbi:helix-turn-helix domain-containing protein [Deinococcus sp.]|uniref:helix-turn-helix domain-containing protein n=1 Tax=Deinococcus sp. TaxID=47478 RepID=UPI003CC5E03C